MLKDEVDRWNLDSFVAEPKQQTVFFRNAVEAPCIVLDVSWKVADFLHPLTTPRPGIEERNYTKRSGSRIRQPATEIRSRDQLRSILLVRIKEEVDLVQQ